MQRTTVVGGVRCQDAARISWVDRTVLLACCCVGCVTVLVHLQCGETGRAQVKWWGRTDGGVAYIGQGGCQPRRSVASTSNVIPNL
jgi:hypothetical protein